MKGNELTGHSGNDEIGTPQWLYDDLTRRFKFDYDAAASHINAKAVAYSTIEGSFRYGGLLSTVDGLGLEWADRRVFVNPPYGHPRFRLFIEKAIAERNSAEIIVMLAKYDSSTENGRLLREHFHLEYLPRIKYAGMDNAATFASVIAIAKPDTWRKP